MITGFKPMLASPADFSKLDFSTPLWLSPKLDGIRAIVIDGVVMSRSLKPIPNRYVQELFSELEYYDGELIVGSPTAPDVYRNSNSGCMSVNGEPEVTFYVFDHIEHPSYTWMQRRSRLIEDYDAHVLVLPQDPVFNLEMVEELEGIYLGLGYEGVMLRKAEGPESKYKFGRATAKSNGLLKVKRMATDEAEIIGVVELERNMNEATTNALGHTERSSHKDNKVAGGTMGALAVKCLTTGVNFQIGTGFTADDRGWFWENRETAPGLVVTYNHFLVGRKELPRFPSYKGLRDRIDL